MSQKKSKSTKPTTKKNKKKNSKKNRRSTGNIFIALIFGIFSLFCALSLISPSLTGSIGQNVSKTLTGIFGLCSVLIPVYLMLLAVFWNKYITDGVLFIKKTVYSVLTMVFLPAFISGITLGAATEYPLKELYSMGNSYRGGGFIGGSVAQFFGRYLNIFAPVLTFVTALIFILLTFGITPAKAVTFISELIVKLKSDVSAKVEERKLREQEENGDFDGEYEDTERFEDIPVETDEAEPEDFSAEVKRTKKSKPVFSKQEAEAEAELHRGMSRKHSVPVTNERAPELRKPVYDYEAHSAKPKAKSDDIGKIIDTILDSPTPAGNAVSDFTETDLPFDTEPMPEPSEPSDEPVGTQQKLTEEELDYTAESIGDVPVGTAEPTYKFPPISLLKTENNERRDVSAELDANAEKLMQLLEDFNVKAEVTHISYGPTITRYELKPAPGVRVASITKLVDDISMSFGTMGVRIEAPIPGKEAVGIEVPNRDVSTVRLRSLIDSDTFKNAESKLFCALGKDVVGDPVYLDIAKMPHLLIAGATGMGKSVCINSLITSILYKASPDEVKLILIDPKKVEFVPYANLPHLLTPVVSDPKKAAGALHWAVSEMERRYDLIESVGVRNIFGYNEITASDPEKENLPQVVIIIDELADLMMTAKQDVEQSIARLAQKARAAGMHLILGTQRPSVSIVTGLIKANVPSRIACKMASQVDSRTILDVSGAEKLIGRGDMLYAPVGIAKPKRLQGAFVSDSEVEAVTSFIRKSMGTPEYAKEIIEKIEKEAQNVGNKHSSDDSFDSDDLGEQDELLLPAIEFAFDQGKVSTSLFQRKLSIGYGRAAKIIDCMQAMGICSAAEGNKPRTLTMTREEYYERYGQ